MLNWDLIQQKYNDLVQRLTDMMLERNERAEYQKKLSQYGNLLSFYKDISSLENDLKKNQEQAEAESDQELKSLYLEEIKEQELRLRDINREIDDLLYPADEHNKRSVFLELRAGAGGQESSLFVADLFKMYSMYATARHWEVSIVEATTTDISGYSKLVAYFKGKNVYKYLKYESGVHRVQRVPKTETQGRVHTSTVTVAVLPEIEDVEIAINANDLRIDVYRSGGAGGQHVNTTDSAVRITHIPTGTVVTCQDERSQIKNKAKAMKVLQARIYEAERAKKDAELSAQRKQQVGTGERAEKIRTYNFPQNRVTDHRTEVTLKKLDLVMQGDLEDLIEPLLSWDLEQRRKQGSFIEE